MSHSCTHWRSDNPPTADATPAIPHRPIHLPTKPTAFRVHTENGRTQDCTLHPDGRMTMLTSGQTWTSALSFDEMRELNWAGARIEWDPAPLPGAPPVAEQPTQMDIASQGGVS
ncbi:hypothetical protein [Streptomyces sp. NPDC006784]|uniref:hypothetical protein n=1 Tax=Streptomyces sp. NPDC006784 TaxID=3364764 RepID=UPI00368F254E